MSDAEKKAGLIPSPSSGNEPVQPSAAADFFATGGGVLPSNMGEDFIAKDIAPGTMIQRRYEVQRQIGSGAMGTVYLVHDSMRGRELAIKVLHGNIQEELKQQLQSEMSIYEQLNHEGIARTFDFGVDETLQRLFVSMEYIDGVSLEAKMQEIGSFSVQEVVDILEQLASTLAYVHKKGFVHRDLKPSNIMFTSDGKVKILDFGIAKQLLPDSQHTGYVGTAVYMAPEQLRGGAAVSPAADVYSIAVILYQLLTDELFYGHMPGPSELLKERGKQVPFSSDVDHIVMRALQVFPEKRFQTMDEFFQAFQLALSPKNPQVPVAMVPQAPAMVPQAPMAPKSQTRGSNPFSDDPFATPKKRTSSKRSRRTSSNPPEKTSGRSGRSTTSQEEEAPASPDFTLSLALGVVSLVLFCMGGIVALVFHGMAKTAWQKDNYKEAKSNHRISLWASYISLGLFVLFFIGGVIGAITAKKKVDFQQYKPPPPPKTDYYVP